MQQRLVLLFAPPFFFTQGPTAAIVTLTTPLPFTQATFACTTWLFGGIADQAPSAASYASLAEGDLLLQEPAFSGILGSVKQTKE